MSNVMGVAYAGPLEISLQDVKDHLTDLPKNATQRLRAEQDGIADVITELTQSVAIHGDDAGIASKVYQSFVDDTAIIEKLSAHENVLEKALEVVRETKAKKMHDRENSISQMVDAAKSTAQRTGNKGILGPFENTLRYNSQIAEKAAQTRRKNADAKGTPPAGQGTP
jgi:Tfp pilus assembly major pilin PilA